VIAEDRLQPQAGAAQQPVGKPNWLLSSIETERKDQAFSMAQASQACLTGSS
jgi:hypothetical protein